MTWPVPAGDKELTVVVAPTWLVLLLWESYLKKAGALGWVGNMLI